MLTGQLLPKAKANGMRTIVVYATRGDAGEARDDLDHAGLGERRTVEAKAACAALGVDRVEFLDHADSGMVGTTSNSQPNAFCNADPMQVADDIAERLADEDLLAVAGYDANGTYGHPDHLQIHAVAHALARRMQISWVLDATYNREYLAGLADSDGHLDPGFASSHASLTHFVQGEEWFRAKMEALKCHNSQAPRPSSKRPKRTIDMWRTRFGTDWFITHSPTGVNDLGPLASILEDRDSWPGPLAEH